MVLAPVPPFTVIAAVDPEPLKPKSPVSDEASTVFSDFSTPDPVTVMSPAPLSVIVVKLVAVATSSATNTPSPKSVEPNVNAFAVVPFEEETVIVSTWVAFNVKLAPAPPTPPVITGPTETAKASAVPSVLRPTATVPVFGAETAVMAPALYAVRLAFAAPTRSVAIELPANAFIF